jgi:formylglycine-generating enzyme required for sulfatase activity
MKSYWKHVLTVLTVCMLLAFLSCKNPTEGEPGEQGNTVSTVTLRDLSSVVPAPEPDQTPEVSIETAQYTGIITWKESDGYTPVQSDFVKGNVYVAIVLLEPKAGWTFAELVATAFSYAGASSITFDADTGAVTITFPPVGVDPVTLLDLTSLVTPPAAYEYPVTTPFETEQYTGTITYGTVQTVSYNDRDPNNADGTIQTMQYGFIWNDRPFHPEYVYSASVALTPKGDYTFLGLPANSFTHSGASSVTLNNNTVTLIFLETGPLEEDKMVFVPGGEIPSGVTWTAGSVGGGLPQTVAPFYMAAYEMTYTLYAQVIAWGISHDYTFTVGNGVPGCGTYYNTPRQPVTMPWFVNILVWCNAYSERAGKTPVYKYSGDVLKSVSLIDTVEKADAITMDSSANGYRLPNAVEREYAVRGAVPSQPYTSTDPEGWPWNYSLAGTNDPNISMWWAKGSGGNEPGANTHPIGSIPYPNTLGIYDLGGNAYEYIWTERRIAGGSVTLFATPQGLAGTMAPLAPNSNQFGFRVVYNADVE